MRYSGREQQRASEHPNSIKVQALNLRTTTLKHQADDDQIVFLVELIA